MLTSFLLLAFMAGAWGNVLAAAFCPRIGSAHECCLKHTTHQSSAHEMHDMDMGDMQMEMSAKSIEETSPQEQIEPSVEVAQNNRARDRKSVV